MGAAFWKDKVVFLTGASSGIGEAISVEVARQGAILGLIARRAEMLEDVASKVSAVGGDVRTFACDVNDETSLKSAAEAMRAEFGHIDILIANAGIGGKSRRADEMSPDQIRDVVNTNLFGAVNAVSAVLPQMLERGKGHLVAVSSLAGFRGLPRSSAYSASKAAMTAFFESVRLDVNDRGVAVTIVQPGFIKTPLTSGRKNKMPFLMELEDSVPHFLRAIENKKRFAAFPWQLATLVRLGRIFPAWLYDQIAGRAKYRE